MTANCKIDDGTQINLEMQASRADLHSSQPAKGMRRHDRLARTCQITFCSYTVFPGRPDYVNSFSLRHDGTNVLLSDALRVIFVELSKPDEIIKKSVSDMSLLDKWPVFFQYAANPEYRETVNKVIASEEVLTVAWELLMSISKGEKERALFRSRRKFQTDPASDMATAGDLGIVKGMAIGRAKGEALGVSKVAVNLKRAGSISFEEIARLTGLSLGEIEKL